MLSPVFHIYVVAFLLERSETAYAEPAREELLLVFVEVGPCFCQCGNIVLRSVVEFLDMGAQVDSSRVALALCELSGAFGDIVCVEMGLIGVRSATEVTFRACFSVFDRTIGHAMVYSLMLSHMSLVTVTFFDFFGMFAYVTPVEMVTSLR